MVEAFNRGRAKNRETHALLVQLFELQVEHGFMLSLKWIPTAENSHGCDLAAVTGDYHSHSARHVQGIMGRDGPI